MNHTKTNPVGVDYKIGQLQTPLYNHVAAKYGLGDSDYDCYPRVYKNIARNGGYLPQAFVSGNEYTPDTLMNDNKAITSFFDISEAITVGENLLCSTKVFLYFFIDLSKLLPDVATRNDEEVINDIVNFVNTKYHFLVVAKQVGITSILKDYTGYKGAKMDVQNIGKFLCFRLDMEQNNYLLRRSNTYQTAERVYSPIWVKPFPVGVDWRIQTIQIAMFNYLLTIWNITADQYNCFGRIYRNKDSDKTYIPQYFIGQQEYTSDTFLDDTKAVTSYFDVGESVKINKNSGLDTAKIYLYFFVNLAKIYTDGTQRNDEECRLDVISWINTKYSFLVQGVNVGIRKVMSDYSGGVKKALLIKDMQPIHIFRIELLLPNYNTAQGSCFDFNRQYEFAPTEFASSEFA